MPAYTEIPTVPYFDQPAAGGGANQLPSHFIGVFKNDGTVNVPVKTDSSGDGFIYTAIGRDSGLDVNGLVTAHLVARDGAASGTDAQAWSTRSNNDFNGAPLNLLPGNVQVSFSSNQDQNASQNPPGYTSGADGVSGLPNAAANREVWADVVVLDQFGNRTADNVDLANSNAAQTDVAAGADQASTPAFFGSHTNDTSATGQFTGEGPQLLAWDRVGQTAEETLTVTANGTTTSVDSAGVQQPQSPSTQGASTTINWYGIDYANSTFTLTHSGSNSQLVNSTVTETYHAVDQKGQPLVGVPVVFYRGGPDTQQDGNPSNASFRTVTDQNGNAFYVYKGVATGVGNVTAVPADPNGAPITSAQRDDSVTFVAAQKLSFIPKLTVVTRGGRDYLTVTAPAAAAGAVVRFSYLNSHGHWTTIKLGNLDNNGVASYSIAHSRYWRGYIAGVGGTSRTYANASNEVVVK